MADVFSTAKRSEIMSRVRSKGNKSTELRMIDILRAQGLIGWRRNFRLVGNPDFVFPKLRLAIFVDGCFWHSCPLHGSIPSNNQDFWKRKLANNAARDHFVSTSLKESGWRVLRVWQHDLKKEEWVGKRIRRFTVV